MADPMQYATHINGSGDSTATSMSELENRLCPGCKLSAVNETGGLVVAFGQSFFHVDCFKCAKCNNQVTADTNLLLLSDGSPICANCSYNCNVCHQPILDEAIMTGDDSYHAHCFKCKVCSNRIDELVFAKTSQGIYCMNCHSERMAKIRRHAQKKREREKAAGGSGSSATREQEAREFHKENGLTNPSNSLSPGAAPFLRSKASAATFRDNSSTLSGNTQVSEVSYTPSQNRVSLPSSDDVSSQPQRNSSSSNHTAFNDTSSRPGSGSKPSQTFSVTVAPPDTDLKNNTNHTTTIHNHSPLRPNGSAMPRQNSQSSLVYLRSSSPSHDDDAKTQPKPSTLRLNSFPDQRGAYDDNIRRPDLSNRNGFLNNQQKSENGKQTSNNLGVPGGVTSRIDKRRSINPVLPLNYGKIARPSTSPGPSSQPIGMVRSQTAPVHINESSANTSPSSAYFPDISSSRRTSNNSLLRDSASGHTVYHSPSSSPGPPEDSQPASEPSSRARSASSGALFPDANPTKDQSGIHFRSPLRQDVTLQRPPARLESLASSANSTDASHTVNSSESSMGRRFSPIFTPDGTSVRPTYSRENSHSTVGERRTSANSSQSGRRSSMVPPPSPSHAPDVPHSIESGTDTDEGDSGRRFRSRDQSVDRSPVLPPKENKARTQAEGLKVDIDPDASAVSQFDSSTSSEDASESSPVERTSVATFIAPALPPIRFSMTGADFSDLFKSVGGLPSLKSLDNISQADEGKDTQFGSGHLDLSFDFGTDNSTRNITPISESSSEGINGAKTPVNTPVVARTQINQQEHNPLLATYPRRAQTLDVQEDQSPDEFGKLPSLSRGSTTRERAASESRPSPYGNGTGMRDRLDSNVSLNINPQSTRIVLTSPDSNAPKPIPNDNSELVLRRLREALSDASERGAQQLKFDKAFIEAILAVLEQRQQEVAELRNKYDGTKRASQQYIDGLTVAQKEYDRELKARRNAEAEVIRLRVLLSGQAAKITALSGEAKRHEARQLFSEELSTNLDKLENDLSKLKVERDMTLAEVEELCASKSSSTVVSAGEVPTVQMSRSLTMRLDNIKTQYQHDLVPLTKQREALVREIAELKATRDQFLEETTVLNARNEELAQLNAQYARRVEASRAETPSVEGTSSREEYSVQENKSTSFDRNRPQPELPSSLPSFTVSTASTSTLIEDTEVKFVKLQRSDTPDMMTPLSKPRQFIKWPGSKGRDPAALLEAKGKGRLEHIFHQSSVLRFTRCDHCGDKLWGSQFRCSGCHISIHARCVSHVQPSCSQQQHSSMRDEPSTQLTPLPPSMFGRELIEQVKADSKWGDRKIPILVEKCIDAVEALALDYEGIYRKTGGSGQSKAITQLFERGDYASFDLRDSDRFNDICSVTSVLKTYFRSLPVPLLTFDSHEEFIVASGIKDPALKTKTLQELVTQLPIEHHHTLRLLMLHLHRVREHSAKNLMNARNLGVVFGPTLMRSRDPGSEFSDMAGKALSIEWLVDNAPSIFQPTT